ncbi:MAG: S9 family peptidase [Bacteroidetes bacterium]|nr:S9 family peptidase [Bacteroidota bacterium]
MMKKILQLVLLSLIGIGVSAQTTKKIPLNHNVYDSWKSVNHQIISNDGKWVSFEVNPQKGDGVLYLKNIENNKIDSIKRAYDAVFSGNSDFLVFKIKAPEDSTRKAKVAKKKDDELPKDSIGIWTFYNDSIKKYANLKSFKIPVENSNWLAFLLDKQVEKSTKDSTENKDSTKISMKKKPKTKKPKKNKEIGDLYFFNPIASKVETFKNVTDFNVSKKNSVFVYIVSKSDSIDTVSVFSYNLNKDKKFCILKKNGYGKKITIDEKGNEIAFLYSSDTSKTKKYNLMFSSNYEKNSICVLDSLSKAIPSKWSASENKELEFSEDGSKLYFGIAPNPKPEKKDTIPEDEIAKLDVWNWNDGYLQTQQLKELDKEKKRTYLSVYHIQKNEIVQLADENVQTVSTTLKGNTNIAIGINVKPYQKIISWETNQYKDVYVVDILTGKKKLVLTKKQFNIDISPTGNFIVWYEPTDTCWYSYSVQTSKIYPLNKNLAGIFCDNENDVPQVAASFGIAGWADNDEFVFINDKYDVWKMSPENKIPAVNTTNSFGFKNKIILRYLKLDRESLFLPKENILLKAKNDKTKQEGFFVKENSNSKDPKQLTMMDCAIQSPIKSKNSTTLIWQKNTFKDCPDLWTSDFLFSKISRISNANPQQSNYLWGSVEFVKWITFEGKEQIGLLYKPENFDSTKKYPMISYFYEKYSDQIHNYYPPSPSRSVINFPLYTSNGYLVFIPDIDYKVGFPGESAYNSVVSGTMSLINKKFVDKDRIGIQGQSWGGYQVAYLVTRTNLYKAAMAGAPVSNMTSAYGGIRWESGQTRMHQYENGQSRIGGTLWENQNLYIENSPLFYADKVETPLLIMSNDNDGAVPWSQGVEYFSALRRLGKPVWLLCYNGDEHNLMKRPNRKDLSIRMMQFFDYYLKNAQPPSWMIDGVPAIEKGENNGYQLK